MSNYLTTDGLKIFSLLPEAPLRPEARGICHIVNPALNDLDHLQEWTTTWQMCFNPDKCELHVTHRTRNVIQSSYSINNTTLKLVPSAKCLRMIIDSKLNFNEHVNDICKKANTLMHLSSKHKKSNESQSTCIQDLCMTSTGVCFVSLGPSNSCNIDHIEAVQHRAASSTMKDWVDQLTSSQQ